MNSWLRELRLLVDVLVDPGAAVRRIRECAPIGRVLVILGGLQAILVLVQGHFVLPAVLGDPLLAEAADPLPVVQRHYWTARALAAALGPGANLVRAAALATALQGCGVLCGVALPWRALLSLGLHLDLVFWIENLCVTVLLGVHPPAALADVASLRLHAGLDLIWHPVSHQAARWIESANVFTLWWALLIGWALVTWMRDRRAAACAVSTGLWLALVGLRVVTTAG